MTAPPKQAPPQSPPPPGPATPPPAGSGSPVAATQSSLTLDFTPTVPRNAGIKAILMAVEGWGKTSTGAFAPNPIILMSPEELGYHTLLRHQPDIIPAVASHECQSWSETLDVLDQINRNPQHLQTVVIDAASGFEAMCHQHVCDTEYDGEWGEKGFTSYHKGYETSLPEWRKMLSRLERLTERGLLVLLLSHVAVKPFKNPDGSDYDRYQPDMHHKTASITNKWADAIFFGKFYEVFADSKQADKNRSKGAGKTKAIGKRQRVIYTDRRDAWDAKNRFGMPEEMMVDEGNPRNAWDALAPWISPKG